MSSSAPDHATTTPARPGGCAELNGRRLYHETSRPGDRSRLPDQMGALARRAYDLSAGVSA